MTPYKLLLVENSHDPSWSSTLRKAVIGLADITVVKKKDLAKEIQNMQCDLILIHAAGVPDVVKVIQNIKRKKPAIPIIVVTTSPKPEIARRVFLAGAADYIYQSVNEAEIRNYLSETLGRS